MKKSNDKFTGSVALTKRQVEYLDKISNCCRYKGGRKLSKSAIIRALVQAVKDLNIDVCSVKCEKELKKRIVKAFCNCK